MCMYCAANVVDSECLDLVHSSCFQIFFFFNQGNRVSSNSTVVSNTLKISCIFFWFNGSVPLCRRESLEKKPFLNPSPAPPDFVYMGGRNGKLQEVSAWQPRGWCIIWHRVMCLSVSISQCWPCEPASLGNSRTPFPWFCLHCTYKKITVRVGCEYLLERREESSNDRFPWNRRWNEVEMWLCCVSLGHSGDTRKLGQLFV